MNIAEYKAEFDRCQRKMILRMVYALGMLFIVLAIASGAHYLESNLADVLAPIIIFLLGFPLMLYGFYRVDRVYKQFPLLICSHCQGNLSRCKSVIIATGNCPECGRRVLNDTNIGC